MSADQGRPEFGALRVNEAGEEELFVFGSWVPRAEGQRVVDVEMYPGLGRWRVPVAQKRAPVVSSSPLGDAGALTSEQQTWADSSRNRIRRAGHRRGGAREVLIELFAREQCALTVQEIDRRLGAWLKDGVVSRPVGIASVYRGVEVLQDLRLITRVDVGDGLARYERAPLEQHDHHHHHFVCDKCGLLVPFDDDALEQAIDSLESRLGFEAKQHEVVLHGICAGCL